MRLINVGYVVASFSNKITSVKGAGFILPRHNTESPAYEVAVVELRIFPWAEILDRSALIKFDVVTNMAYGMYSDSKPAEYTSFRDFYDGFITYDLVELLDMRVGSVFFDRV